MNNLFAGGVTLAVLPYLILTTTTTTKNLQIRHDHDEPYFTDEETAVDASEWHGERWGEIRAQTSLWTVPRPMLLTTTSE